MLGRVAFAALILIAVLAAPVRAADFQAGEAAYGRGDYQTALLEWRPLAEQGDAGAQSNLGLMYRDGHGVAQDYGEAMKWWRLAAEQGDASAQHNLGVMYAYGRGEAQNYGEAKKWWRLAAEQGHAIAQYGLGTMYRDGQGVPQDYVLAHMWFNLAAAGLPPGMARASAAHNRDISEKRMTPAQVADAQKLAREWKPKAQAGN